MLARDILTKLLEKLKRKHPGKVYFHRGISNEELFDRMERTLTRKRLYLDNKLSIKDVAREAASNRTYVTRVLSAKGLNFKSYINSFRIQYAIELMGNDESRNLKVGDIAERSGFASERAMNYYLVKTMGVTACMFRKRRLSPNVKDYDR